jgi:AP2 domain
VRRIPLRKRDGTIRAFAIVDDKDFDWLSQWCWRLLDSNDKQYAFRYQRVNGEFSAIAMHRVILDVNDPEIEVDHKNGNGLDNQRDNIRAATRHQNNSNRHYGQGISQYRGVDWHPKKQKWRVRVMLHRRSHHIGYFDNELEAAEAAKEFRRQHMPYSEMDKS